MAISEYAFKIRLIPDDETMAVILAMLNMWQDAHPDLMVAMVPAEDRYQYEIIKSGRSDHRDSGA